jgi:hypothetical protein
MTTSATIDHPASQDVVNPSFPVRGTSEAGCTGVTVIVTSSSGTSNYDAPVAGGEYDVIVTAGPGEATVAAYCTASGPETAAYVTGLTVSDS